MSLDTATASREFVIARTFDAPRELVWKVWTEPAHIRNWWGPRIFSCSRCEIDLKVGGAYLYAMRAEDGSEFPLKGRFLEIVVPEKIVMTMDHSGLPKEWHDLVNPDRPKEQLTPALDLVSTVTFEARGSQTEFTLRTLFDSAAMRDRFVQIGMREGWIESLEKFAEELQRA